MKKIVPVTAVCLLSPLVAFAQQPEALTGVVVSANRTPTAMNKVGSSVDVITQDELKQQGFSTAKEYLEQLPSVNFTQNGPVGSSSGFSIRGANQAYVLVRIDGVDISDPSLTQVAAALEHILVEDIARIEVLRGSQSALYGGQAVGGVIDITTKRGEPGIHHRIHVEAGSFGTKRGSYGLSAGNDRGDVAITLQKHDADGFSSAEEDTGNKEEDGYENTTANLRASYDVTDLVTLKTTLRRTDSNTEFDDFVFGKGPADDTLGNNTDSEYTAASLAAEIRSADEKWTNTITVSGFDTERDTTSSFASVFEGKRRKIDYLGSYQMNEQLSWVLGANKTDEDAKSTGGIDNESDIKGGFVQLGYTPNEKTTLTTSFRGDKHSEFGQYNTWRVTGAYLATPETKLRMSAGTGFRAPSIFELFDTQYGNTALEPETSESIDFGVDHRYSQGLSVSATLFAIETTDLIQFVFPAGYSQVKGEVKRKGAELAIQAQLNESTALKATYTRTDSEDANGDTLIRVPKHDVSLSLNTQANERTRIGLSGRYIDGMLDKNYTKATSPIEALDSYVLLNAKVSYQLNDAVELYARGENLLDKDYQTVWGYGTADRSGYVGANIRF